MCCCFEHVTWAISFNCNIWYLLTSKKRKCLVAKCLHRDFIRLHFLQHAEAWNQMIILGRLGRRAVSKHLWGVPVIALTIWTPYNSVLFHCHFPCLQIGWHCLCPRLSLEHQWHRERAQWTVITIFHGKFKHKIKTP